MTKRQALITVRNMAKRIQLDHTYKGCKYHNRYMRQQRAMEIVDKIIKEK